jgi:beta-lactamase regulating signal transducer with metallopeptidase domain
MSLGQWLHRALLPPSSLLTVFGNPGVPKYADELLVTAPLFDQSVEVALLFLWLLGFGLCLSSWGLRLRRQTRSTADPPLLVVQLVSELQDRLGVRHPMKVRCVVQGGEVALSGAVKSVVLIPRALCDSLQRTELEAVLMHELIHAKRWDNLVAVVVHLLVCVFWFHPGLWWIERKLLVERELACDEGVIEHGASPEAYIAGILKICRFNLTQFQPGTCGVFSSNLQQRIRQIASYTAADSRNGSTGTRMMAAFLGAVVTLIPLVIGFLQAPALYGRAKGKQKPRKPEAFVSCVFGDKEYPEGSAIEQDEHQQMCVEAFGKPLWVRTSREMRDRSQSVTVVPIADKPAFCVPIVSKSNRLCSCEGSGIYSPGSIVNSAKGMLTCSGGKWNPFTGQPSAKH